MRVLASLILAGAVAVTAAPAGAITRTVHVPLLDCYVRVETSNVMVSIGSRGVRVDHDPVLAANASTNCAAYEGASR